MQHYSISVQRTAHYSTRGVLGEQTKYLVLACHGYGQLAKHFIRKFDVLDREDTFVIAPEGLSRFYWGGISGDVVASWMTKEDRLEEIADYCAFLVLYPMVFSLRVSKRYSKTIQRASRGLQMPFFKACLIMLSPLRKTLYWG